MHSVRKCCNGLHNIGKQYRYIITQHCLFSTMNVNSLKQEKQHIMLDSSRDTLVNIHKKSGSRLPIAFPTNVNTDIKIVIDTCRHSKKIVSIIEENADRIIHGCIYGKAMQKCNKLRDFKSVQYIMDMLLVSGLEISIVEFTIYFNSMSLSDHPERCVEYFRLMVDKYGIQPNEVTFCTLIKSFRWKSKYKEAEKMWDIMTKKYNLKPVGPAYTSMMTIYAAAHQTEKANKLMNEYMYKFHNNEILYCGIFGAYVSVFAKIGDINGMKKAIQFGTKYGMELKEYLISTIMRGYYSARKYEKCVKIFDNWLKKGNIPNATFLRFKCIALCQMIRQKDTFEEKEKIYNEIDNCLTITLNKYEIKLDSLTAKVQLSAAIFCYGNYNPMKIIHLFEMLLSRNLIGYRPLNKASECIDLHFFEPHDAQFMVRYLIGYKLHKILKDGNNIKIITGKGEHAEGKSIPKYSMYHVLVNELANWDPPLKPEYNMNPGVIYIGKEQLLPYLNDNNYAKQKLNKPSNDWYDYDPRKEIKKNIKKKKYSDMYGDVNRKRVSTKLINELRDNLISGQIFKVCNQDEERKYKLIEYVNGTEFIVYDFQDDIEKTIDMKTSLYKVLL